MPRIRIVAWNANCAVHRKLHKLRELRPDVAIVPECATPAVLAARAPLDLASVSAAWVGRNENKGLAVFGFGDWKVTLDRRFDERLQWIAPIHVTGPVDFHLLAVWASNHRASVTHPLSPVHCQPTQAAHLYRDFITERPTVVAGDFNNHLRWDRPGKPSNFSATLEAFASLGLRSAYHVHRSVAHGNELEPTHSWRNRTADGPTYHIDYVFLPEPWLPALRSFETGDFASWTGAGMSDHVPLVAEVDLG